MRRFEDKVTIVTGGASGIGRELCRQLGEQGASEESFLETGRGRWLHEYGCFRML